jgi:hypothetical protein
MNFLVNLLTGGLNILAGTIGKTIVDVHTSETTRQTSQNTSGERLAGNVITGQTAAGEQRAGVQKSQGAWGPFGIAGFVIAMTLAFHVVMIVGDSMPWHLAPAMKWYVLPWLEWVPHKVGSWGVAALPGRFEETEHEILKALFYVGPPSAAIAIAAKAFRR